MISLILATMIGGWDVGGFGGGQAKAVVSPLNPAKPIDKPVNPIFPDKDNPIFPKPKPGLSIDGRNVTFDGSTYSVLTANGLYIYSHSDFNALSDQVRAYDSRPFTWTFGAVAPVYATYSSCYTNAQGRKICR